jgi:hypothetical protein
VEEAFQLVQADDVRRLKQLEQENARLKKLVAARDVEGSVQNLSPALEHDAVEIDIRLLAVHRLVPPGLDLAVDFLVEVGHRAGARPGAPQRLGDVSTRSTATPARNISSTELSRRG